MMDICVFKAFIYFYIKNGLNVTHSDNPIDCMEMEALKVKPKHLDRPLVAGCCTGPKHPSMLADGIWAKLKSQIFFCPKMVSVMLVSSFTDV